jgi:heat shock protein HslJ
VLSAGACAADDDGADRNPLAGSRWEVTSLRKGAEMQGAHPTTIVTIVFGTETAEGYDGCNRYVAPYDVDGDTLTFGDISRTGVACAAADHVTQADAFVEAVEAVTEFTLFADELELRAGTGALVRFRRVDDLPLTHIAWSMTGYRTATGGMTSPLDGAPVTLWFGPDGDVGGSTGCNSYSAEYRMTGAELSIHGISQTEMACAEPAGVMAQEAGFLALLASATSYRTDLTTLELLDAGDVIAAFAFGGRTR